jgi:hypothetical protein
MPGSTDGENWLGPVMLVKSWGPGVRVCIVK